MPFHPWGPSAAQTAAKKRKKKSLGGAVHRPGCTPFTLKAHKHITKENVKPQKKKLTEERNLEEIKNIYILQTWTQIFTAALFKKAKRW